MSHGLVVTLPISYSLDGGTLWDVTCALQTEPNTVQTLAADRKIRLLQIHITFLETFVIFVVIVAYDVTIVLFQICMHSPVHRIKQKISYQSDSVQHSVTQMA